jgi:hypothetical protein
VQAESSSGTVVNGHSGSNNKTTQVAVSHSRNSSDSSGYHEASVLSESPAEGHQMSEKYEGLHNLTFRISCFLICAKCPITIKILNEM